MNRHGISRSIAAIIVASAVWASTATVALVYVLGKENLCGPPLPFTVAPMTDKTKYRVGEVVNITLFNFGGESYEGWPEIWIFNWPEQNHADKIGEMKSPNKVVAEPGSAFANISWTPQYSGLFEILGMIVDSREYVLTQSNPRVCMINVDNI